LITLMIQVSRNGMIVAQGRCLGLSSSRKGPINMCLKVNLYEDIGVLSLLTELLRISVYNQWRHSVYRFYDPLITLYVYSFATGSCETSSSIRKFYSRSTETEWLMHAIHTSGHLIILTHPRKHIFRAFVG
jgi:hypothetical protein